MDIEELQLLTEKGEKEYNADLNDLLEAPYIEKENNKTFEIEDVKDSIEKAILKLPLYKLTLIPVSVEESSNCKMRLDEESDDVDFEILEKSKRRIIGGIATTSIIDRTNEEISPKAIKNIWRHIENLPENYLNLMIQHESSQIGVLLKEFRNRKMALLDGKIYVIAELRQDIPLADKVWRDILSKKIHSMSIKINIPKPLKKNIEEICDDDKCWTRINDAKFLEVSLVVDAANPDCEKLDILSKENQENL